MTRALVAFALPWLLLACTPSIPSGVFECTRDDDCPPDLRCEVEVERCYAPDGG